MHIEALSRRKLEAEQLVGNRKKINVSSERHSPSACRSFIKDQHRSNQSQRSSQLSGYLACRAISQRTGGGENPFSAAELAPQPVDRTAAVVAHPQKERHDRAARFDAQNASSRTSREKQGRRTALSSPKQLATWSVYAKSEKDNTAHCCQPHKAVPRKLRSQQKGSVAGSRRMKPAGITP